MNLIVVIPWLIFVMTVAAFLVATQVGWRADRLLPRLRDLARGDARVAVQPLARSALARLAVPLTTVGAEERNPLRSRMLQAGLYGQRARAAYLTTKAVLMGLPWLASLVLGLSGWVSMLYVGPIAGVLSAAFLFGSGLWLDRRKRWRQGELRYGLPDVLDLLVLCVESGLSVHAAFRRVAAEVRSAHPLLGLELNIVEREMQLGLPLAEALKRFADRCDLDEVNSLGRLFAQTERLGTGLTKALRGQAEMLRFRQVQQAEERAGKAAAKMMLPMMLFIFPGIFFVILGPAWFQYQKTQKPQKPAAQISGTQ
jgi:tight adherence protein C